MNGLQNGCLKDSPKLSRMENWLVPMLSPEPKACTGLGSHALGGFFGGSRKIALSILDFNSVWAYNTRID